MKNFLLSFLMLNLTVTLPSVSDAFYLIQLKNGGRILTSQYREEGNYLILHVVGGTMGIEKSSITNIKRSTIERDGGYGAGRPLKSPAQDKPKDSMFGFPEREKKEISIDDTKQNQKIMMKFKSAKNKYELRSSMTVDELTDFKNELSVLRDEIVTSHLNDEFSKEVNEIADMRFFVNDLLIIKSKNQ